MARWFPAQKERVPMPSSPGLYANVSERLQAITNELRNIEEMLVSERLESAVLTDFRDAVNRVRTTAWAVAQYLETGSDQTESESVLSLLASERVRITYRLCRLIEADLSNGNMRGKPLVQLYLATQDLANRLSETVKRDASPASALAR